MQPIGTTKIDTKDSAQSSSTTDVTPTAPATTAASSSTAEKSGCSSSDFDALDDALKQCGGEAMPKSSELPPGLREKLEVKVTASTPQIQTGGRVDVTIVLRNKSSEPLTLFFSGDPNPHFDVEAVDAKGKRVDWPSAKQPAWPKGTGPATRDVKASKITLEKSGTARLKLTWDAYKTKWAPDKAKVWDGRGFPRTTDKPLPPGKYTLRVVVPLIGAFEKNEIEVPKLPIEVVS